ncbi:capsular biosynthesis protein [Pseudomonas sp. 6D_7.1_Bac1]|uniref:capsule biosynthesis protein n=1 Tax=Pseudomonas sp. 6D_7.1_Bac1 TaxID=2971615 RepID=UPI0029056743|nr:capsular biosynthesis protein [Pseudomonas sp. 6D_7.1_Bac1]
MTGDPGSCGSRHSFLFLQSVSSPFFAQLGQALRAEGQYVTSVSFTMGDMLYGSGSRVLCTSAPEQLEDFYRQCFASHSITDVVLFGDQRPVHQPAIQLAKRLGLRVHVFEEGYFRPYWITLERDGVNANSLLPRDPTWYRDVGKSIPTYRNGQSFRLSFAAQAFHDVMYHASGALNPVGFPRYRTHAPYNAAVEYASFIRQRIRQVLATTRDSAVISHLVHQRPRTFLLPLQLDSDAQIRDHSSFKDMSEVLERTLRSFATHALSDTRLLIKNHPLSPGLVNYHKVTREIARKYAIADRVDFLESGHMPTLLSHSAGVVTVNSTVGGSSLMHNLPTLALGNPIYALKGLTHSGNLESFWRMPQPPDATLFQLFRNTVIHTTQVNGGFYTQDGIGMAVSNAMRVLMAETSRIEQYL